MRDSVSIEELESRLAQYLMQVERGERLQTVRELVKLYNASTGAVSKAMNSLEDAGAVTIDKRGHLGSFLKARSMGQLWLFAEREPMVIAFPLVANSRVEGLATGLKKQIREVDIDVYFIFIRGSRTRLQALKEGRCHIAVMSNFAANDLCDTTETIVLKLPPSSYVASHQVFYSPGQPAPDKRLRVAIDRRSFDIERLTELEFPDNDVELVSAPFMQLHRVLERGDADAGIWSIDDMHPHLNDRILFRPLSEDVQKQVNGSDTSAVLVARSDRETVRTVIETVVSVDKVLEVQKQVLDGKMVPEY